jgi:hypothetical protein
MSIETTNINQEAIELKASAANNDRHHLNDVQITEYTTFLNEPYRPPSKGGNTKAWHRHALTIEGVKYSFLAQGAKKWIYKTDRVSFQWQLDKSGKYRNILYWTIATIDKDGKPVKRGLRDRSKPRRTAPYKLSSAMRYSPLSFDHDKLMGDK